MSQTHCLHGNLKIHSLILSSSPTGVLANISKNHWLLSHYYGPDIPQNTKTAKNSGRVKRKVLVKLLALFSIGPVVNILMVAVVLEKETSMTFKESGFRGLAWGVNMDLSLAESYQITESCKRYRVRTEFHDEIRVQFSSCNFPFVVREPPSGQLTDDIVVAVGVSGQSEIFISALLFGKVLVTAATRPQLFASRTLFQVKADLSKANGAILVERGLELVSSVCETKSIQNATEVFNSDSFHVTIFAKKLPCHRNSALSEEETLQYAFSALQKMRKNITFVEAGKLDIYEARDRIDGEETSFIDPTVVENMPFLIRRERNLSVALLGLMCCLIVALRIATIFLLNNDVGVAVELVFKRAMGMGKYESLLQTRRGEVYYPNDIQATGNLESESGNLSKPN